MHKDFPQIEIFRPERHSAGGKNCGCINFPLVRKMVGVAAEFIFFAFCRHVQKSYNLFHFQD